LDFRRWELVLLAAILLLAAFFRLYRLEAAPPGLQHDEVFHGHDASVVLQGAHRTYFESNAGNEPLFVYLMTGAIALFGSNYLGIRTAAVLRGLATIIVHLDDTCLSLRRGVLAPISGPNRALSGRGRPLVTVKR